MMFYGFCSYFDTLQMYVEFIMQYLLSFIPILDIVITMYVIFPCRCKIQGNNGYY